MMGGTYERARQPCGVHAVLCGPRACRSIFARATPRCIADLALAVAGDDVSCDCRSGTSRAGDLVAWLGHLGCCYTQVAIGGSALRDPVAQMKKTTVHVYLGDQIDQPSEKHALSRLRQDLERRGIPARILANFVAGKQCRQIDLFIVTPARIVHCELKGYELPVVARCNGPWQLQRTPCPRRCAVRHGTTARADPDGG